MQLLNSDSSSSSASCSSRSSSDAEMDEFTPAQLLSLAIKKRRSVYNRRERDFRRELLHTGLIQSLCKFLGEGRARRRRHRRSKNNKRRCSDADRKREWSDNAELASSEGTSVELTAPSSHSSVGFEQASSGLIQPIVQRSVCSVAEDVSPPAKKCRICDDSDPFGLDKLFAEFYGRKFPSGCHSEASDPVDMTMPSAFNFGTSVPSVV